MDDNDLELRNLTYGLFVELGRAPTVAEVADRARATVDDVRAGWGRLHEQHAIVLDADGERLRMANPFSAVQTSFCVEADGRTWYANCAWDAFGICAALHVDVERLTAVRAPRLEPPVDVRGGRPSDESLLFHCLVPAGRWWADIVFT